MSSTTPQHALSAARPQAPQPIGLRRGIDSNSPGAQNPIASQLRRLPLFRLLDEDAIQRLAVNASIRRYARDDRIVTQGERDSGVFVITRGRVHLERQGENGRTVLLGVLSAGDRVGDWALIDGGPHHAGARCNQATEAIMLSGDDVLRCQARSLAFSNAWCQDLVGQLRERNHRILRMSLYGVRERVIWRLSEWAHEAHDGRRVVSGRIGRTELARMVGASREMVCRVLRGLQNDGLIHMQSDRSIVLESTLDAQLRA